MELSDLTFIQYLQIFGYLFLPVLIFGVLVFGSIILSNRMGGKNQLIVFFTRLIMVGLCIFGLIYYFSYFVNVVLIGG